MNIAANNIKSLMENKGISTITELSELSGVSLSTISTILSGKRNKPRVKTLEPLAKYFETTVDELLGINSDYSFPELLNDLMNAGSLNEYSLAKKTGISRETISSILRGNIQSPNEKTLRPLSQYFNLTIEQLKGHEKISIKDVANDLAIYNVPLLLGHNLDDLNFTLEQINDGTFVRKIRSKHSNDDQFAIELENDITLDNKKVQARIFVTRNRLNMRQQTVYYNKIEKNLIVCKEINRGNKTFIQTNNIFDQPILTTEQYIRVGYFIEISIL